MLHHKNKDSFSPLYFLRKYSDNMRSIKACA